MIHLFPRWVWYGAFLTTFSAGSLNTVAVLTFFSGSVSHVTGTFTKLAQSVASLNLGDLSNYFGMLTFFFIGSVFSGYFINSEALRLKRRYSLVLLLEALLLVAAYFFLVAGNIAGEYLASMSCGLQNAMISNFSGSIIRTTHMTGIFTDLGAAIGRALKTHEPQSAQILIHIILILGFVTGAVAGTFFYANFKLEALWLPIAIITFAGIIYGIYAHRKAKELHLPAEV